jgi:hypothetical protein
MSTKALSKIKTARKPAKAESYPCDECGSAIFPGQEYFSYQIGLRSSVPFCLKCARSHRPHDDTEHGRRGWHELYRERYGVIEVTP